MKTIFAIATALVMLFGMGFAEQEHFIAAFICLGVAIYLGVETMKEVER